MESSAMPPAKLRTRHAGIAFLFGAPIAILGGLIGLGGAEFRLPVLVGPLGYAARQAVPLNLAVSLVTVTVALAIRSGTLTLDALGPVVPAIAALIAGSLVTAFIGPSLASHLSDERLERVILVLLVAIGCALIIEGFLPQQSSGLLPADPVWRAVAGFMFGLGIGLVGSLLGVAGGELIIPTLVFAFGVEIKTAGTASLFVSLPMLAVGIVRYAGRGAYTERRALVETVLPMSLGSVVGAVVGGLLAGIIPAAALKIVLGVILNVSAFRIFRTTRKAHG